MSALLCLILTSLTVSLVAAFAGPNTAGIKTMDLLISGAGALMFSFFIVYDVQLISGGKHQQMRFLGAAFPV